SCSASSATSKSPSRRIKVARTRRESERYTASTVLRACSATTPTSAFGLLSTMCYLPHRGNRLTLLIGFVFRRRQRLATVDGALDLLPDPRAGLRHTHTIRIRGDPLR